MQNYKWGKRIWKKEILEKASKRKVVVGEMEKSKIDKSNWIALIVAVVLMIVEGVLEHFSAIYAIGAICFIWASVFYFCQYFIAKRPYGVLIGGILTAIGATTMLTFYILINVGIM